MGPTSMHESALSKTIWTLGSGSGSVSGSGEPIPRGPMDKFTTSQPRQSTLNSKWKQEERKEVCRKIDGNSRCLINFLVNSLAGTWFMKSIDDFDTIKNGELMFNYIDKVVEEIGEENVVQVITDNASNYVNAGMRLMEKRRRLWWTPYAAHCIDLMLEDIGKLNVHATTLSRARQVVKFIYEHTWVLSLMRTFTKNHELLRPQLHGLLLHFLLSKVFISKNYYLNPQLRYGDKFSNVDESYCIDSRTLRSPTSWWMRFGGSTPELQKFAIESLALLVVLRDVKEIGAHLNRYNTRLRERSLQRKQNVDLILVEEIDSDDEWIAEKEDPLLPLIFVGFKIMSYSVLMLLELCHPTPRDSSIIGSHVCKLLSVRIDLMRKGKTNQIHFSTWYQTTDCSKTLINPWLSKKETTMSPVNRQPRKRVRDKLLHGLGRCIQELPLHLTIEKLNGKNYREWVQAIKLVIDEKGKLGFLTDETRRPPPTDAATSKNGGPKTPSSPHA
ncbi:hypothetical protein CK203_037045 [Vitis vinifera]|uniref:DUF659 domain-containing protein n=1 Tax=Vitis vinifera TaxID=29760 RepID=A0A438I607_VITVI|nr:hypothetical protein CK203_037045 [Vitis vinifera]